MTSPSSTWPSPRPVLVFDGDCGFCTTSARFVRRWVDRRDRYAVMPWQQLDLAAYGLTEARCSEAAQFVADDGTIGAGHEAIAMTLRHGAPGWRPIGHLVEAPGVRWLSARAYAWIADHRYALPGGTPACAVPPRAST
ncbi:MAG: DCC1-like thiol-disulfide oxidoreductase family protein [Lapillicoccus sp.]